MSMQPEIPIKIDKATVTDLDRDNCFTRYLHHRFHILFNIFLEIELNAVN